MPARMHRRKDLALGRERELSNTSSSDEGRNKTFDRVQLDDTDREIRKTTSRSAHGQWNRLLGAENASVDPRERPFQQFSQLLTRSRAQSIYVPAREIKHDVVHATRVPWPPASAADSPSPLKLLSLQRSAAARSVGRASVYSSPGITAERGECRSPRAARRACASRPSRTRSGSVGPRRQRRSPRPEDSRTRRRSASSGPVRTRW